VAGLTFQESAIEGGLEEVRCFAQEVGMDGEELFPFICPALTVIISRPWSDARGAGRHKGSGSISIVLVKKLLPPVLVLSFTAIAFYRATSLDTGMTVSTKAARKKKLADEGNRNSPINFKDILPKLVSCVVFFRLPPCVYLCNVTYISL
jgi:hypothetical protein